MIKINPEFEKLIPPLADDELKQLESNLIKEGWRNNERIFLWNDFIVDGHNRYKICLKNNIDFKTEPKQFTNKNEVILWMIENQLGRRNLPDYARVELNLKKEDVLRPLAKENQRLSEGKGFQKSDNLKVEPFHVHKKIAEKSHVSHDTVARVKYIRDHADEETKNKLRAGDDKLSIHKVYVDLKAKEKREQVIKECNEAVPIDGINKKYNIIYADPPWKYFESGLFNQSNHYKTLSIEDIKNLPVQELCADDCILFLWVTFPILKESFEVMESWGFKYVTCGFNWVKRYPQNKGWVIGLGSWTRANSELCLIGRKGSPIRQSNKVSQIIDEPREEHSKKPAIVRNKIVELCGDIPRIELFARESAPGWDVWGNQVNNK